MAVANAYSTLLLAPCAKGVPVSGFQLRRNLVTKTQKTTIMAAKSNPAVQHEAVGFTCQLRSDPVATKRGDKVIAAAFPITTQLSTDVPESTTCKLENSSGMDLPLDDKTIWEGSRSTDFPKELKNGEPAEFVHNADSGSCVLGSVGALEYLIGDNKVKWIIAWSNAKSELNKVYTAFIKDVVDWDQIKESLDKAEQRCSAEDKGLVAHAKIDPTNSKAMMEITLKRLLLGGEDPSA